MGVKTFKPGIVNFKMGDTILEEGNFGNALYIIKKGQVEVFEKGKDGKRIPLAIVNSGEFIGEMGILNNHANSATAIALTDIDAYCFPKDVIENQIKEAPAWLVGLAKGALKRVIAMNEVLRRNDIVDERLMRAIEAAESHFAKKDDDEESN